jgi:hypothetical protein
MGGWAFVTTAAAATKHKTARRHISEKSTEDNRYAICKKDGWKTA